MAREELGAKRICPETGKKFYDLNKDPIISPYTGKAYPRSFFDEAARVDEKVKVARPAQEADIADEEEVREDTEEEFVSLEEVEEEDELDEDSDEVIPDLPDVEIEVEVDEEADDTFLDDEDEEDDYSNVIGGVEGDEEV